MELETPEVFETCDNPKHWEDLIVYGHCLKCKHKLADVPEEDEDKIDLAEHATMDEDDFDPPRTEEEKNFYRHGGSLTDYVNHF